MRKLFGKIHLWLSIPVGIILSIICFSGATLVFEKEIMGSVKQTEQGAYLTLDPEKTKNIMESLKQEVAKLENIGKNPIVITSPIVRMYFKKLTEDYFKDLIVVSYNEVESNVELQSVGMVTA